MKEPTQAPAGSHEPDRNYLLLGILLVSAVARAALAFQGGQFYFGDESRYRRGADLYFGLLHGNWDTVQQTIAAPDHAGFTLLTAVLAPFQHLLAWITGHGNWAQPEVFFTTTAQAAMVLGLCSTLNIWLVYRLTRAAGGSRTEANFAALLTAAASSLFYHARHLFPYDAALSAALAGMLLSVSARKPVAWIAGGGFAAASYELYNGYWFMVPAIFAAAVFSSRTNPSLLRWLAFWMAGALATTGLIKLPGMSVAGGDYWRRMTGFSRTVTQGDFAEGWSLPWQYLWHTESGLGIAIAGAIVATLIREGRRAPRVRLWALSASIAYALLVAASVGLEKFVVYGRMARPLAIFLCLLGGYSLAALTANRRQWRPAIAAAIALGAALNFAPHFLLVFPNEAKTRVWREFGVPHHTFSFTGCINSSRHMIVNRPDLALVNADGLFPFRDHVGYPDGIVLFAVPHPASFAPYQYEGYNARERSLIRHHSPEMRLVRLSPSSGSAARP